MTEMETSGTTWLNLCAALQKVKYEDAIWQDAIGNETLEAWQVILYVHWAYREGYLREIRRRYEGSGPVFRRRRCCIYYYYYYYLN